jgi:hypothetical protein
MDTSASILIISLPYLVLPRMPFSVIYGDESLAFLSLASSPRGFEDIYG